LEKKTIASSKGLHGVDGFRAVWAHGCVSHLWAASDAQRLSVKFSLKNPFFFAAKFADNLPPFLTRPFQATVPSVQKEKIGPEFSFRFFPNSKTLLWGL